MGQGKVGKDVLFLGSQQAWYSTKVLHYIILKRPWREWGKEKWLISGLLRIGSGKLEARNPVQETLCNTDLGHSMPITTAASCLRNIGSWADSMRKVRQSWNSTLTVWISMMCSLWAACGSLLFAVCKIGRDPFQGQKSHFFTWWIYFSCDTSTSAPLVMNLLLWWTYSSCDESTSVVNLLLLWWIYFCGESTSVVDLLLLWWIYFCGELTPLVMNLLLWWTYFSCDESTSVVNLLLLWWIYFCSELTPLVMNLLLWWTYSSYGESAPVVVNLLLLYPHMHVPSLAPLHLLGSRKAAIALLVPLQR